MNPDQSMNPLLQSIWLIAFGASCWAIGDFLLKLFFKERVRLPAVAWHTLAFTAGNVGVSYLMTGLGFAGLYLPWTLRGVFFAGIGLLSWKVVAEGSFLCRSLAKRRVCGRKENEIAGNEKEGRTALFLSIVVVAVFLIPAILQAAAPPYVRDSLVYHLLCPKEYIRAGRLVHIPGNLYSAFPKGHEVMMTLLLGVSGDRAAQGFSILQQIAAIGEPMV